MLRPFRQPWAIRIATLSEIAPVGVRLLREEAAIARAFQLPGGHVKLLHLAPPGATSKMFIDMVQWLNPSSTGEPYPSLNHVGINRLAFRVSDIGATTAALRERGITFLTQEPQSIGRVRTISRLILMGCSFNSSNGRRSPEMAGLALLSVSGLRHDDEPVGNCARSGCIDREIRPSGDVELNRRPGPDYVTLSDYRGSMMFRA